MPVLAGSKLFVYADLAEAKAHAESSGNEQVWQAEVTGLIRSPAKVANVTASEMRAFWSERREELELCRAFGDAFWCDSVKLIDRAW